MFSDVTFVVSRRSCAGALGRRNKVGRDIEIIGMGIGEFVLEFVFYGFFYFY